MHEDRPNYTMDTATQIGVHGFFITGALIAIGYAIYLSRKDRVVWPLFLLLGGVACVFYEVVGDIIGQATYPEQDGIPYVYHLWGRYIPLYILWVYVCYFGITAVVFMKRMQRGESRDSYRRLYGGHVLFCMLFEPIPIAIGMWHYWGDNQPFSILNFPIWWWFANSSMILNATALMYLLHKHLLSERQSWLLVPAYPLAVVGCHMSVSMPMALAFNSGASSVVTNICAVITIGLALTLTWIMGLAVERSQSITRAQTNGHDTRRRSRAQRAALST